MIGADTALELQFTGYSGGENVKDIAPPPPPAETGAPLDIPEGIRKARAHLRRDLPALLASWWTRGKWACYCSAGRVKIGRDHMALVRECNKRGIPPDEWIIERIDSRAGSEEEEEIDSFNV
jgi:hypothetical protein